MVTKTNTAAKNTARSYVCKICGYVYEPSEGDPSNGVPAGTPFEKLPAGWVCPLCGVGKEEFSQN